eukprot:UN2051
MGERWITQVAPHSNRWLRCATWCLLTATQSAHDEARSPPALRLPDVGRPDSCTVSTVQDRSRSGAWCFDGSSSPR